MSFGIVFTGPRNAILQELELPSPGPNQLLLRSRASLISTGTELTAFSGRFDPDSHWHSWVKYPFLPGYATVAEIQSAGKEIRAPRTGERVVARLPHASHHLVEECEITYVSDSVSDEEAVWFALAKIAFTGLLVADLRMGARVVVVGAGPVGQMLLRWVAMLACELIVVDRNAKRLELCQSVGGSHLLQGGLEDKHNDVIKSLDGHHPEVIFDCTGNPSTLAAALAIAADHGMVVILGDTGFPALQHITSDVVLRGVKIAGAHDRHTRHLAQLKDERDVYKLFFRALSTQRFSTANLITHTFKPDQAQEAYLLAESARGATGGILFDWTRMQ